MYLNIVLTLILLVFTGNLWANLTYGKRVEQEQANVNAKQEEIMTVHWLTIEKLDRIIKLLEVMNDIRKQSKIR